MSLLSISVSTPHGLTSQLEHFGRRLADARSSAGISATELARAVGCRPSAVWGIEHGRSLPSLPLACRIADALGTNLDQLIRGER